MTLESARGSEKNCIIIGLDGLEYDLVEKFSFENLKQKECGKIDLSGFKTLATPTIWASFITGLPPEKHKVEIKRIWNNDLLDRLSNTFLGFGIWHLRTIFELIGFRRTHHVKKHFVKKGIKTIFDLIEDSIALDIPSYQEYYSAEISKALHDAIEDSNKEAEFEAKSWKLFEKRRKKCIQYFESSWKLFMAYFNFTDHFGHVFRGNIARMFNVYQVADELVANFKARINNSSTLFLVVSDHGMKTLGRYGVHSNHGFYSINKKLGLSNPKITDFYYIMLRRLGYATRKPYTKPSSQKIQLNSKRPKEKSHKEQVLDRLKELGYF